MQEQQQLQQRIDSLVAIKQLLQLQQQHRQQQAQLQAQLQARLAGLDAGPLAARTNSDGSSVSAVGALGEAEGADRLLQHALLQAGGEGFGALPASQACAAAGGMAAGGGGLQLAGDGSDACMVSPAVAALLAVRAPGPPLEALVMSAQQQQQQQQPAMLSPSVVSWQPSPLAGLLPAAVCAQGYAGAAPAYGHVQSAPSSAAAVHSAGTASGVLESGVFAQTAIPSTSIGWL
jgi:hypothetical protein